jgi:hypothetical protein
MSCDDEICKTYLVKLQKMPQVFLTMIINDQE